MNDKLRQIMMNRGSYDTSSWDANMIFPRLYVGSLRAASDVQGLMEHGVKHILTVANDLNFKAVPEINHSVISIVDHPAADILSILPQALQFLDDAMCCGEDENILVHCASGVSRSVTVCCAYLMTRQSMLFDEALRVICEHRKYANPNVGFMAQLEQLQEANGNIQIAIEQFRSKTGNKTLSESIAEQRDNANEHHSAADKLEVLIMSSPKEYIEADKKQFIAKIESILHRIDEAAMCNDVVVDRAARMIRKSAAGKCQRLLAYVEGSDYKSEYDS